MSTPLQKQENARGRCQKQLAKENIRMLYQNLKKTQEHDTRTIGQRENVKTSVTRLENARKQGAGPHRRRSKTLTLRKHKKTW